MNKNIIAMAVAAALVAPMAAQAEATVSGRVGADLISASTTSFKDFGQTRIQFDAKDESGFFARYGIDARLGQIGLDTGTSLAAHRDAYVGVGSWKIGRMSNVGANLEKDAFIATSLQLRGAAVDGAKYGSGSFLNNNISFSTKVGGSKLAIDYILPDSAATEQGHYGLAFSGKAGSMGYYVGMNNGDAKAAATGGVTKAGIKMPMGGMTLSAGYESVASATAVTKMHLGVAMKMAGGNLDVTFADKGKDNVNSFYRIAFGKKASDNASWHVGMTQNGATSNAQTIGGGIVVKF